MKLNPGEVICDKCKGEGNLGYSYRSIGINIGGHVVKAPGQKEPIICDKCQGSGKLDWVEAIVGKKPKEPKWYNDMDIASLYPSVMR